MRGKVSFSPWERGKGMVVEVEFKNGKTGYVDRTEVSLLINSRLISAFKRSNEWVRIGLGPIRQKMDLAYRGEDKRSHY